MDPYRVMARRWRPRRFEDLVGQEAVVRTLMNAVRSHQIAHAYLFVGPRGTGKTSASRLLAMALNGEGGPSVDFNPDSPRCRAIGEGRSTDVLEIDGASNNSVEQVRVLREECIYSPAEGPFKIYILDEVHMLSTAAFNALLKTVEEPPSHVKFIFATTEVYKVPITIVSRCQRLEFRPLEEKVIEARLNDIVGTEGLRVEPAALKAVARLADGGMRDAQSMLDQLLSFGNGEVTLESVQTMYGIASEEILERLSNAVTEGNYEEIVRTTDRLVEKGNDLYRVIVDLRKLFREKWFHRLKTNSPVGTGISNDGWANVLAVLQEGEERVQRGLSPRVMFEMTLFKAVEAGRWRSLDTLIEYVAQNIPATSEEDGKKNDR
jgi:DNA polymerase-3 subunit gamma/tau